MLETTTELLLLHNATLLLLLQGTILLYRRLLSVMFSMNLTHSLQFPTLQAGTGLSSVQYFYLTILLCTSNVTFILSLPLHLLWLLHPPSALLALNLSNPPELSFFQLPTSL
ncbi:hypothetical protein GEMRC1_013328 [Eukaryota sp. GEM-RC1]